MNVCVSEYEGWSIFVGVCSAVASSLKDRFSVMIASFLLGLRSISKEIASKEPVMNGSSAAVLFTVLMLF